MQGHVKKMLNKIAVLACRAKMDVPYVGTLVQSFGGGVTYEYVPGATSGGSLQACNGTLYHLQALEGFVALHRVTKSKIW